jgi:hypothetical protein
VRLFGQVHTNVRPLRRMLRLWRPDVIAHTRDQQEHQNRRADANKDKCEATVPEDVSKTKPGYDT